MNKMKIWLTIAVVALVSTAYALNIMYTKKAILKNYSITDTLKTINVDTTVVSLVKKINTNLDPNRDEYFINAVINANNGADSSSLKDIIYTIRKKANEFYIKYGSTEQINTNKYHLFIDHRLKKILISKSKTISSTLAPFDLNALIKRLKEERYTLQQTDNGTKGKITFSNPYHISCKEYSIDYNSKTLKPEKIFMRLTYFQEPENNKKDNLISFLIKQDEADSKIYEFINTNYVKNQSGEWIKGDGLTGYDLINNIN